VLQVIWDSIRLRENTMLQYAVLLCLVASATRGIPCDQCGRLIRGIPQGVQYAADDRSNTPARIADEKQAPIAWIDVSAFCDPPVTSVLCNGQSLNRDREHAKHYVMYLAGPSAECNVTVVFANRTCQHVSFLVRANERYAIINSAPESAPEPTTTACPEDAAAAEAAPVPAPVEDRSLEPGASPDNPELEQIDESLWQYRRELKKVTEQFDQTWAECDRRRKYAANCAADLETSQNSLTARQNGLEGSRSRLATAIQTRDDAARNYNTLDELINRVSEKASSAGGAEKEIYERMLTEVTQERIRARDHLNQSIAEVEAANQGLAAAGAALASAEADVAGRTTARNSAKARLSECEGDLEKVRARQADLKEKIDELIHRRSRLSSAAQPPR
jgi:hypothetical protein